MKFVIYLHLLLLSACYSKNPEMTEHDGKPLPEFNLFLADSSTYFNTANVPPQKPVILFYFGPRCPYSHAQMKDIIEQSNSLKDVEILVFTASSFQEMKWFYKKYNLKRYSNIKAGVDFNNFFHNYFKIEGVPFLAIYGRDKRLKNAFSGLTPVKQIQKVIES